jgi:hypothetical protein
MLVHWLLFCGVSYCGIRDRAFMFDYDTKEKEHQNTRQSDLYLGATPPRINQIASCFDALSITYSDLVFCMEDKSKHYTLFTFMTNYFTFIATFSGSKQ